MNNRDKLLASLSAIALGASVAGEANARGHDGSDPGERRDAIELACDQALQIGTAEALQSFLARHADSECAVRALERLIEITGTADRSQDDTDEITKSILAQRSISGVQLAQAGVSLIADTCISPDLTPEECACRFALERDTIEALQAFLDEYGLNSTCAPLALRRLAELENLLILPANARPGDPEDDEEDDDPFSIY